jgi:hypothetical protein
VPYDIDNLSNEYSETKDLKPIHRHHVKENDHYSDYDYEKETMITF